MATIVKHDSDEGTIEPKKTEHLFEEFHDISSESKDNCIVDGCIGKIRKSIDRSDDDNKLNVNDESVIEKNYMIDNSDNAKLSDEVVDDLQKHSENEAEKKDNLSAISQVLIDQSKNNSYQVRPESIVSGTIVGKRKRRLSSDTTKERASSKDDNKIIKQKRQKCTNDNYCWRCHKDVVDANCSACPRSWHRKCIGGTSPTSTADNWICGECASILQAENATTRPPTMAHLTVEQLCMVLKYVIERMRNCPGAEPFWNAVDLQEVPNYLDYVVKPMDLALLESNVTAKLYGSTDAFMADAKWIQHNCIVFNTCGGEYADTSKLTNAAKQIIKIARQEVSEIEACPDCYARGRNLPRPHPLWFIEACRQPHPLIWAKLKGFPFWPAKALSRINGQGHVDVRFFGEHDRAWVSPKDIYLYSRDPPTPLPRKKKQDMYECMREITQHCQKLEMTFGPFQFAPPRVQYNPHDSTQIKIMFPEYDPDYPYDSKKVICRDNRVSSPSRKQISPIKNSSTFSDASISDSSMSRENENSVEHKNISKESRGNDEDNPNEISEYLKQKNRLKRLSSTAGLQSNQIELSNSFVNNDSIMEKNISVTPKNVAVRKLSPKKFIDPKDLSSSDEKLMNNALQKGPTKNRKQYIRKVNATSTPLLASGANGKMNKSMMKIYKPKTRIVNKLNSEQNMMDLEKSPIQSMSVEKIEDIQEMSSLASTSQCSDQSIQENSSKTSNSSIHSSGQKINISQAQSDLKGNINPVQTITVVKRQSKAKKSFPNKPPRAPIRIVAATNPLNDSMDIKDEQINFDISRLNHQLLPSDAGPLHTQLNRSANELAIRMSQLIKEAIQEAADLKSNLGVSVDSHDATVYSLKLQMERMQWQHQQQLSELKYNADQRLREMRASLEVERLRAIEEIRKEAEEERLKCIEEIKSKQWCSFCGREAVYYCCWNTAYCNQECQHMHWQIHKPKCSQKPSTINSTESDSQDTSGAEPSQRQGEDTQLQAMPTLVISTQHDSSNVRGA